MTFGSFDLQHTDGYYGGSVINNFVNKIFVFAVILFSAAMLIPAGAVAQDAQLSADTYVSSGKPTTNFGSAGTMSITGSGAVARGFIRFDLSTLPSGTTSDGVAKAALTLYVSNVGTAGSFN